MTWSQQQQLEAGGQWAKNIKTIFIFLNVIHFNIIVLKFLKLINYK